MDITAYISINLLLFSSWYVLLYGRRACLSFADRLTGTFILGLTQIIATEMLLGVVFEKLSPVPLFMLNLLISLSIVIPVILTGKSKGIFTEIKDETIKISRIIIEDKILLCIFSLFFISGWWLAFLAYLVPS